MGANFAFSFTGSKGNLIFKAHDRNFQTALQRAWDDRTSGVRDFPVFQFSLFLLIMGVIYDFSSWLFWLASLRVPLRLHVCSLCCFFPYRVPWELPWSLVSLSSLSCSFCPLDLAPVLTSSQLSGISVIRKSPSPAILSKQAFTTYLLNSTIHTNNGVIVSPRYS